MLRSLTFSLLCMCVLIGSADAKSRNPRQTDFDEVQSIFEEEWSRYVQLRGGLGWVKKDSNCGSSRGYFSANLSNNNIKLYVCLASGSEMRQEAYLNELDFSKAYVDTTGKGGATVVIPCIANRQCLFGHKGIGSLTVEDITTIFQIPLISRMDDSDKGQSIANKIVELLQPN